MEFYFSDKFFYFGKTQENGWFLSADGVFRLDLAVPDECIDGKLNLNGSKYHLKKICDKRYKTNANFSAKELAVLETIYKRGEINPQQLEKIGKVLHESMRCRTIFNKCQKTLLDYAKSGGEFEFEA